MLLITGLLSKCLDKDTHHLKTEIDPKTIKTALLSLYTNNITSNLETFKASMYLQIPLSEKIFSNILPTLDKENILNFVLLLDGMDYSRLEQRVIMKISLIFDDDLDGLSLLPLSWIGKVLTSDYWCVEDEYTRYESLKTILMTRRERMEHLELEQEIQEKKTFSLIGILKNLLTDEQKTREILPLKESSKIIVPKTIGDIYEKIVYTFMPHYQLSVVKQDGIIPLSVILESFWIQNESINVDLPNYRYNALIRFGLQVDGLDGFVSKGYGWNQFIFRLIVQKEDDG
ncbi:hypothetical protein HDV01_002397 [Terramyces sp. JEL0728]|nr:hypothetical protein HDV01_002397 [Terramyces sp. JEL0728]